MLYELVADLALKNRNSTISQICELFASGEDFQLDLKNISVGGITFPVKDILRRYGEHQAHCLEQLLLCAHTRTNAINELCSMNSSGLQRLINNLTSAEAISILLKEQRTQDYVLQILGLSYVHDFEPSNPKEMVDLVIQNDDFMKTVNVLNLRVDKK